MIQILQKTQIDFLLNFQIIFRLIFSLPSFQLILQSKLLIYSIQYKVIFIFSGMDEEPRMIKQKQEIKRTVFQQINALKPPPNATPDQAIECLVKQAEFYTNFLLSKHEIMKKKIDKRSKRRGHFDQEESEVLHMIEEEEHQQETFTRLNKQPACLKGGQLKYYQLVGLNWMISLYESGINGILADDMGLGKTIQTISIISFIKQFKKIKGPHIIIAPKITLGNWENQFKKWMPCCRVVKLIATKEERQDILQKCIAPGKFDVVLTSFEGVRICLSHLKKIKWHYVVIDEAHKIKNQDSQLSQVVRKLNTQCKLLLTGTPLQNNLHELWSLLNFLLPQIFSNSEMFDIWFNSTSEKNQETEQQIQKRNMHMISQLHKILKPFMLRRTKLQVEKNLPPKKEIHIFVGLTDVQLKVYKNLLQNRNASEDDKKHYLNLLMQLRKACNHPYLFEGVEPQGAQSFGQHLIEASGKLIVLDRLLTKLKKQGKHQVLIFSQMTMVLDILEDFCNFRSHEYCRIDGSTDMVARDEQIQQFMRQNTSKFVFLLSTRAGGLGINLTSADTVIIYDSDWNPQMDLQAMDRAHRIGQKSPVNVYRLITENTVEQKIIERQTIKLKWDHLVIQQAKSSQKNKALTKEQMKEMLQFGASVIIKSQSGTISDEAIDIILQRGESKTIALNKQVQEKLKTQQSSLTDFSMNSINIFDFMQRDQQKKKEDAQALDQIYAKQLMQNDVRTRREKGKNVNYALDAKNSLKNEMIKKQKKVTVPEHHFFENKDLLVELLQKQQDYESNKNTIDAQSNPPLIQQQQKLKEELLKTGFTQWSKNDFTNFIAGCQKFGRNNFSEIVKIIGGKSVDEVKKYSDTFWKKTDELSEKQKIIKQIQTGEEKIQNRKAHYELLQWKAGRCYQIDFNPNVYTKFKSKLYSIEADRYLAQNIYHLGLKNMSLVRQKIRKQPMFRFDHFLRSRTESELNKRLLSIYKLIEKQKDNDEYGLDIDVARDSKKKQKKKKQEQKSVKSKGESKEIMQIEDQDLKKPKQKQTLLTAFSKKKAQPLP